MTLSCVNCFLTKPLSNDVLNGDLCKRRFSHNTISSNSCRNLFATPVCFIAAVLFHYFKAIFYCDYCYRRDRITDISEWSNPWCLLASLFYITRMKRKLIILISSNITNSIHLKGHKNSIVAKRYLAFLSKWFLFT